MKKKLNTFLNIFFLLVAFNLFGDGHPILRENMARAIPGDYIVTNQGKMFTVLYIRDKMPNGLILEEISAPKERIPKANFGWRSWIENDAPGNTSWVMYKLNTGNGEIEASFSYTKNCWFKIRDNENFLSTLMNTNFHLIPYKERKRVGPRGCNPSGKEARDLWNPKMIVNGRVIENVSFHAWKSRWPNDGSDLAGKAIEIYIPEKSDKYPSYFPYWLQISGIVGNAKIRIVESGSDLRSPKPLM